MAENKSKNAAKDSVGTPAMADNAELDDDLIDLDQFLPYRATRLSAKLSKILAAHYQQEFDVSVTQWRVLVHLTQQSHISIRDIFDRVDMDRARVTRAVQQLEARHLVTKDANQDDRRLLCLALTDKGHALAGELAAIALSFEEQLFAGINADSRSQLLDLIDQLEENLSSMPAVH
jgi:DNA-binding MarR family transcriptional regulator